MRATSRFAAAVVGLLLSVAPCLAHAGDADDTVFLKNGGRVRGTVIEEDPAKGLRLRVADGTIRVIAPKELDHVQYASDQAKPETPGAPPAVAPPVAPPPAAEAATEGVLRIESSEPGTVSIDGADFGRAPAEIPHLAAGRHLVSLTWDGGGGVVERKVMVRPGVTTPVMVEPTISQVVFHARTGLHFGAGAEGLYWFDTNRSQGLPGARVFGRLNYAAAKALDLRVDAALGVVSGSYDDDYGYGVHVSNDSLLIVPLTTRFDAQLNLGSVYSMSAGVDLGISFTSATATIQDTRAANKPTTQTTDAQNYPVLGVHGSLLTFRLGPKREFLLSLQEGVMNHFGDKHLLVFEQTLGLTYLFGLGAPAPSSASPEDAHAAR